jgi:hypothetical protein
VGYLTDTALASSNQALPEATAMREILWKTMALIQTCYTANLEESDKPIRGITILSSADLYWFDGSEFKPYPPDNILISTRLYLLRAIKQMEVMVHRFYAMSQYPGRDPQISIVRAGERVMGGKETWADNKTIAKLTWPYGFETGYQTLSNHLAYLATNDMASFTLSHVMGLYPEGTTIDESEEIGYPEEEFDDIMMSRIDEWASDGSIIGWPISPSSMPDPASRRKDEND